MIFELTWKKILQIRYRKGNYKKFKVTYVSISTLCYLFIEYQMQSRSRKGKESLAD